MRQGGEAARAGQTSALPGGSTLSAQQTAYIRRLLFEELARTAESLAEQANNAAQAFKTAAGEGDDSRTTAHSVLGPVIDLLDTTGWDIARDGDLALAYERRFRGRDNDEVADVVAAWNEVRDNHSFTTGEGSEPMSEALRAALERLTAVQCSRPCSFSSRGGRPPARSHGSCV